MISSNAGITKTLIETLEETENGVKEIKKLAIEMDKKISEMLIVRGITENDLPQDFRDGITNLNTVFDMLNKGFALMMKQQVDIDRQLSKNLASGK